MGDRIARLRDQGSGARDRLPAPGGIGGKEGERAVYNVGVVRQGGGMCDWQDTLWKLLPVFTSFGVLIFGSWLTRNAKRSEWIADNQKEEYRKLLAALNRLNMAISALHVKGTQNLPE